MNIIGLPIIYLIFRYWSFSKIMPFDLPALSADEHTKMISYSKKALLVIMGFLLITIILEGVFELSGQSLLIRNGPALVGVVIAIYFDLRAESLKRKGRIGVR